MEDDQCDAGHKQCAIAIARLQVEIASHEKLRLALERTAEENLRIAREELARRLDILNGEHERFAHVTAEMVRKDVFELLVQRVNKLEGDMREQIGRLWLPLLGAAAAVTAALAAAVTQYVSQ